MEEKKRLTATKAAIAKFRRITGRFFDPLKMAESITDSRIYGFTVIRKE